MLASGIVVSNFLRVSTLACLLCAGLVFAACGDGPGTGTPTAAATKKAAKSPTAVSGSATVDTQAYPGPDPKLGGNIKVITPTNGQTVTQADTRSPNPQRPRGICFEADFTGLEEQILWFRMALDDKEVTESMTWVVASQTDNKGGRGCYAPAEGFAPGRHSAAVSVRNPNNANEPPKQIVAWRFEVK